MTNLKDMRDKAWNDFSTYHACLFGDCRHQKQHECSKDIFLEGFDAAESHMKAQLAEFPVTIRTLQMQIEGLKDALEMKEFTLQNTFNHWQEAIVDRANLESENARLKSRLDGAGL